MNSTIAEEYCTNQSLSRHGTNTQDGGDLLHVLAVWHAGFADDPALQDRLHVAADLAALGGAGGGMLAPE